ncbi:MAG: glycosyltransferase family 4 protein [Thermoguttaceae bacterium]
MSGHSAPTVPTAPTTTSETGDTMRIAHIITRLIIGGAQENTVLCCEDLVRIHGDEVLLITGGETGPEGSLFTRLDNVSRDVPRVPYCVVPSLCREIRPLTDLRCYFALRKLLREFRPDVVHTHSAKAGILGRIAASSLGVKNVVHTVHGAPFWSDQSWFGRQFNIACEKYAARHCHKLISVADAMTDQMIAAGIAPREKFVTVRSGMEVETFLNCEHLRNATRQRFRFDETMIVVGKVARLFPLKGHNDLLLAARDVIAQNDRVRFLLIGDGILTPSLKQMATELGIADRVVFAGLVSPSEIPAMMSAVDIVVHTSLREGLARVLPQALLAGRPAISYDIDGAREVIVNDETGYLVNRGNISELVRRILQLANDAPLRNRLAATGRDRCRTDFDHREMTKQLREIYAA